MPPNQGTAGLAARCHLRVQIPLLGQPQAGCQGGVRELMQAKYGSLVGPVGSPVARGSQCSFCIPHNALRFLKMDLPANKTSVER